MPINWQPFVELVSKNQSFLLTSHMRPDCDALGSELGMAHALRSRGKDVQIVNGDEVPPHIALIDPDREIQVLSDQPPTGCDVLIALDTSA